MRYIALLAFVLLSLRISAQEWNFSGAENIAEGSQTEMDIDAQGTPYVAYIDLNSALRVLKFNGTSWIQVGDALTAGPSFEPSIAIDAHGTPYVAYNYGSPTKKANVMKFNGSSWVYVGSPEFSTGLASYLKVKIAADGTTPYVCFSDNANSRKAVVMKYNGSAWVSVGSPAISSTAVAYPSIAFAPDGTLYLAYQIEFGKAMVVKYNGSAWTGVGQPGFTTGSFIDLEIDGAGIPYVASMDDYNSGKAVVMKFNDPNWVTVGSSGISTAMARRINIDIHNLVPYIVYQNQIFLENGVDAKIAVRKFNGTSWVALGDPTITQYNSDYPSLAVDANGTPYVAFGYSGSQTAQSINVLKFSCTPSPPTNSTEPSKLIVCPGASTTLTVAANEVNTVYWYDQQFGGNILSEGKTFVTQSLSEDMTFYASAASDCGVSTRVAVLVTLRDKPVITISGNTTVCKGEEITMTASGAITYQWENGSGSARYNVKPQSNTNLTVTGTDANNCSSTASVTITVKELPDINISGKLQVCPGENTTLTATGANTFQWKRGPATATYSFVPVATATYAVSGTDSNHCTNVDSVKVEVNPVNVNVSLHGNTLTAEATPASYQWVDCDVNAFVIGEIHRTFTPATPGNYAVLVSQELCLSKSECNLLTLESAEATDDAIVNIYPNPSMGIVTIVSSRKGIVKVMNNMGQTVRILHIENDTNGFQIDALPDGLYHLVFMDAAESVSHDRLVVKKDM